MKWLVAFVVLVASGLVGIIATHESRRPAATRTAGAGSVGPAIETISRGEAVTIEDHLSADGYTVVEFTADF